jgi:hypothetical protein
MAPNRNLRVHAAHTSGSTPHIPCSTNGCNRWFRDVSSFKKHVRTKHRLDTESPPSTPSRPKSPSAHSHITYPSPDPHLSHNEQSPPPSPLDNLHFARSPSTATEPLFSLSGGSYTTEPDPFPVSSNASNDSQPLSPGAPLQDLDDFFQHPYSDWSGSNPSNDNNDSRAPSPSRSSPSGNENRSRMSSPSNLGMDGDNLAYDPEHTTRIHHPQINGMWIT